MIDKQYERMGRGKYRVGGHSQFTAGSRGVLVLIKKSLPFHIKETWSDSNGCYTAIHGEWEGEKIVLLNMYVPPDMQTVTLQKVGKLLLNAPQVITIMGGDLNLTLDPQVVELARSQKARRH